MITFKRVVTEDHIGRTLGQVIRAELMKRLEPFKGRKLTDSVKLEMQKEFFEMQKSYTALHSLRMLIDPSGQCSVAYTTKSWDEITTSFRDRLEDGRPISMP